jgi:hypothetical protein
MFDPTASIFNIAGIIGVNHHAKVVFSFLKNK